MAGPNTTGTPNTGDLWLGRGNLLISELGPTGLPKGGWRHMGNCPSFTVGQEPETIQHNSSMSGLKNLDLEVTLQNASRVAFTLEELSHENMALFTFGTKAEYTNASVAGFAEWLMVPDGELTAGTSYDIKDSDGQRAFDVASGDLTVSTNEGPPNVLVEGTDYTLDREMGRIFLLTTSTDVTDAQTLGVGLLVALAANAGANDVNEIKGLQTNSIAVALKFIGENAVTGDKVEFQFHKVRLRPAGDLSLIGDDWTNLNFEGGIERNETADENSPLFNLRTFGDPLPQIVGASFLYDEADAGEGILSIFFDKPIQIDRTVINVLGAIRFRTDDTMTGAWVGSESEYWMSADTVPDLIVTPRAGFAPQFELRLHVGFCASHADTLAENQATIDFAAIGVSARTGHAMPTVSAITIVTEPL